MSRSHMNFQNACKMLGKHGQIENNANGQYWARINGYIVGFLMNGLDSTTCYHTRKIGMQSDLQSDYDANDYWDNLTQAIRYAEQGQQKNLILYQVDLSVIRGEGE